MERKMTFAHLYNSGSIQEINGDRLHLSAKESHLLQLIRDLAFELSNVKNDLAQLREYTINLSKEKQNGSQ